MRVVAASLLGLMIAVPAAAQQQRAWIGVESVSQALGTTWNGYFVAAPVGDGRVLAAGGEDQDGNIISTAALFDGRRNWTTIAPMATPRVAHVMAGFQGNKVLVTGGIGSTFDLNYGYFSC